MCRQILHITKTGVVVFCQMYILPFSSGYITEIDYDGSSLHCCGGLFVESSQICKPILSVTGPNNPHQLSVSLQLNVVIKKNGICWRSLTLISRLI